ncbi:intradiol ring-cleavage dioxygenase [Shewanella mangrovisoli]|uniref:dioxygenase family protein n=1 Tax=Shewanella mangrovisoli TaxID=2864211 RepID=UPI0035B6B41A
MTKNTRPPSALKTALNTTIDNAPRRTLLKAIGWTLVASPLVGLVGCGSESEESTNDSSNSNTDAGSGADVTTPSDWASGGTASMTVNFPDTSLFTASGACALALTQSAVEGPCYFQVDNRDDISDAESGLPMQICFQVIDKDCNPLSGLEVEVWHCNVAGVYSGDTSGSADKSRFNSGYCTGNSSKALQSQWFRGTQVTDSEGRVNFKSCFPGWYSGRTIHVHFRIRNNNNDQLVSQLGFSESLTTEICTSHPEYLTRGQQDTSLSRDNIFGSNYNAFLFNTSQNDDGSLLAWRTLQLN